jgi:hypothetical protein
MRVVPNGLALLRTEWRGEMASEAPSKRHSAFVVQTHGFLRRVDPPSDRPDRCCACSHQVHAALKREQGQNDNIAVKKK